MMQPIGVSKGTVVLPGFDEEMDGLLDMFCCGYFDT